MKVHVSLKILTMNLFYLVGGNGEVVGTTNFVSFHYIVEQSEALKEIK